MTKTITLTGAEEAVIGLGGQNVAIKNLGEGSVYASAFPNVIAGEDNVIEIPAGGGEVLLDARGKVYLLGMGKVQLTGTDYATPNFKLPSSSEGGGGGATGDVTKGYVDAQDALNLVSAKAYTDSKVGAAAEAAEAAKIAAEEAAKKADAANAAATAAKTSAANAETTAAAAQSTAETNKSDISALQIAVAAAQADIAGNTSAIAGNRNDIIALQSELATAQTDISEATEKAETADAKATAAQSKAETALAAIEDIAGKYASQDYVDTHDAATLTAANEYTDSKIQPLQAAITKNAENIQSLSDRVSDTENAIDVLNGTGEGSVSKAVADGIAEAIADAPDSLDVLKEISAWIQQYPEDAAAMNARIQQNAEDIADINNENTGILAQAKKYTDTEIAGARAAASEAADNALAAAKAYTDDEIDAVTEDVTRNTGDISALKSDLTAAQENISANADAIAESKGDIDALRSEIAEAKEYADSKDAETLEAARAYTDTVAADKADKPINTFVIIGTENWENDGEEYPYYYDIPIEGAASAKCAEVFFAADSEEAAKKCEFSTEVTVSDGAVQIRAKHIPETILSANVQIGVLSATNTLHIDNTKSVVSEGIEEHNADPEAHPDIRDSIRELKEQIDGEIAQSIEEHDADRAAHPDLRAKMNELKGRIVALEVAAGGDINANPFAVTFGDLDGVIADGVWVPASARLEF